jgi:hypothetical protein
VLAPFFISVPPPPVVLPFMLSPVVVLLAAGLPAQSSHQRCCRLLAQEQAFRKRRTLSLMQLWRVSLVVSAWFDDPNQAHRMTYGLAVASFWSRVASFARTSHLKLRCRNNSEAIIFNPGPVA